MSSRAVKIVAAAAAILLLTFFTGFWAGRHQDFVNPSKLHVGKTLSSSFDSPAPVTSVTPSTEEQTAKVLHSTTVFRNGHETNEHFDLHQSFREQNDVHFGIGFHDRKWWLRSYSILLMGGCYYYLADDGCWYPAYGFDPRCSYPIGVVYCE